MRVISTIELQQISGGTGTPSVSVVGHNIGGSGNAVGGDFSEYTTEDAAMEANNGGKTVSQANIGKLAAGALACKIGIDKVRKSPTITNGVAAAAACGSVVQDALDALDAYGKSNPDFVKAMRSKPVP